MSNKYGEVLALLEFGRNLGKEDAKKVETTRKPRDAKPPNIGELIFQKRQELAQLEQVYKDLEKLNKKEEKKPEKWNVDMIAMFLLAVTPINWAVLYLLLK